MFKSFLLFFTIFSITICQETKFFEDEVRVIDQADWTPLGTGLWKAGKVRRPIFRFDHDPRKSCKCKKRKIVPSPKNKYFRFCERKASCRPWCNWKICCFNWRVVWANFLSCTFENLNPWYSFSLKFTLDCTQYLVVAKNPVNPCACVSSSHYWMGTATQVKFCF